MKQSEPIKALNGRTHKINLFTDEKENIVLQPYLPVFFGYNTYYSGNANGGALALCEMSKNAEFKSCQIHKYSKTAFELNQTFKLGSKIFAILEMYDKGTDTYHLAYSIGILIINFLSYSNPSFCCI